MMGILKTAGPVCIHDAARSNKLLRSLKSAQFVEASSALERLQLGRFITLSAHRGKGRSSQVFIKNPPDEAMQSLCANPNLCSLDMYTKRYNLPPSRLIGLPLRAKLMEMKLVPKKLLM